MTSGYLILHHHKASNVQTHAGKTVAKTSSAIHCEHVPTASCSLWRGFGMSRQLQWRPDSHKRTNTAVQDTWLIAQRQTKLTISYFTNSSATVPQAPECFKLSHHLLIHLYYYFQCSCTNALLPQSYLRLGWSTKANVKQLVVGTVKQKDR